MRLLFNFMQKKYPTHSKITTPVGIKKMKIKGPNGGATVSELGYIASNAINMTQSIEFPIINGTSPNEFTITYWPNEDEKNAIEILVEEIGGIPNPNYFSDTQP